MLNKKIVYDYTKFSTSDYIGEIACIVWHISCNLRCSYCYNDNIVNTKQGLYSHNDILKFLETRIGLLSAVVLSGGEATIHDLKPFCKELKKLEFKVKLDTNGTNLELIKDLISDKLIDFIAIDFKAPKSKFKNITKKDEYDSMISTIKYLLSINFPFELRTTVNADLLDFKDINEIIDTIFCMGYKGIYYIQNFLQTSTNIGNITQKKIFDKNLVVSDKLRVEYRN